MMVQQSAAIAAEQRDDTNLVGALRAGDESAFVDLVERHHGSMVRIARLYVDGSTAEDVAQETWLALLRGIDAFEGRASLKTWLFRVLANRARTRAAREARTVPFSTNVTEEVESVDPAVSPERFRGPDDRLPGHWLMPPLRHELPEQQLLSEELGERIRDAVESLPAAQRAVVSLRDMQGFSAEEVCALLGVSEGNQRVLLHRGRSKVRVALEAYVTGRGESHRRLP
jgi:RNA polymerase sigma-70 factor (ECF subfamily)